MTFFEDLGLDLLQFESVLKDSDQYRYVKLFNQDQNYSIYLLKLKDNFSMKNNFKNIYDFKKNILKSFFNEKEKTAAIYFSRDDRYFLGKEFPEEFI